MKPNLISVLNQSSKVTDADAAAAVAAIGKQLAQDVAPEWGWVPALEFVPAGQQPTSPVTATISDTPDVQGALGYHDETDAGVPYIKVFVLDGYDWRTTLSHEVLELTGDYSANLWADAPDGTDYAKELCDAVEGDSYAIDGVPVSNFVYQAFFDERAQPGEKLDHLGKLSAPFTMTPGGYQIQRTEPGQVTQVFAKYPEAVSVAEGVVVRFGSAVTAEQRAGKIAKLRARCRRRRHVRRSP